jgi:hypothetical protein
LVKRFYIIHHTVPIWPQVTTITSLDILGDGDNMVITPGKGILVFQNGIIIWCTGWTNVSMQSDYVEK